MDQLVAATARLGIQLTGEQVAQFAHYQELLRDWNQRLNLTAVAEPPLVQTRHFYDSLTCTLVTGDLNGRRLVDVGTGAGFPGLPLKILYPNLELTLLESVRKKTEFLRALVADLSLRQVTILAARAEEIGHVAGHREGYDWAVARAVAPLRILVEYLLPLCRVGGQALAQKGAGIEAELETAREAIARLGGGEAQLTAVPAEDGASSGFLVRIPKQEPTPLAYPRRPGVPKKRPL